MDEMVRVGMRSWGGGLSFRTAAAADLATGPKETFPLLLSSQSVVGRIIPQLRVCRKSSNEQLAYDDLAIQVDVRKRGSAAATSRVFDREQAHLFLFIFSATAAAFRKAVDLSERTKTRRVRMVCLSSTATYTPTFALESGLFFLDVCKEFVHTSSHKVRVVCGFILYIKLDVRCWLH